MRAAFSMISLLVVVALVAYFYTAQPVLQPTGGAGSYQHLQQKAETAAAEMAHNPQDDVDAATAPATNAPPPAPGN